MKGFAALAVLTFVLAGCSAYKELQPDPKIDATERGFVEVRDGKDTIQLDQGKKYFLAFPSPPDDNFYLLLATKTKPQLYPLFSRTFDKSEESITPVADESKGNDSLSVYRIDRRNPFSFWVLDSVRADLKLTLRYRYVPVWRYTIENKFVEYRRVMADNVVDRSIYNGISASYNLDRIDLGLEIGHLDEKYAKVKNVRDELVKLEGVFPKNITASHDTAYEKYVKLRGVVDEEVAFQENYHAVLAMFKQERETRGSTEKFLAAAPSFTQVLQQRTKYPAGVIAKASALFLGRLSEIGPYMDALVKRKPDASPFSSVPSFDAISILYRACGEPPSRDVEAPFLFIKHFNEELDSIQSATNMLANLQQSVPSPSGAALPSAYSDLADKVSSARAFIPKPQSEWFDRYSLYDCAVALMRSIGSASALGTDLQTMYATCSDVAANILSKSWSTAESRLNDLFQMQGASNAPDLPGQRKGFVKQFEGQIFDGVKSASEQRVDAFTKANELTLDNVPQLYADSAFYPVYRLTFSSGGPNEIVRKRRQIDDYLTKMKLIQFPENAIKSIYREFIRAMSERGVEKARAIVEHGKFYGGSDKQVKELVLECDVQLPKALLKPKEYRKLYSMPVTSDTQGVNDYLFRIEMKIPSDAEFPVFDVNLKLPNEVAQNAAAGQWYESITIDNKPVKNEGRFRITAPTAENNNEVLITPLQIDKDAKNVLEVRFKYAGFRVFEVSVMAQVPLIRKN